MGAMDFIGAGSAIGQGAVGGIQGLFEGKKYKQQFDAGREDAAALKEFRGDTLKLEKYKTGLSTAFKMIEAGDLAGGARAFNDLQEENDRPFRIDEKSIKVANGRIQFKSAGGEMFSIGPEGLKQETNLGEAASGRRKEEIRLRAKLRTESGGSAGEKPLNKTATPEKPLKPKEIREEWDYLFGNDEEGITGLYDMEDEQVAGAMAHRAGIDLDVVKKNMAILYRYADETKYEPEVLASIRAAVLKAVEVGADPEQTEKLLKELIDAIPWRASETSGASGDF